MIHTGLDKNISRYVVFSDEELSLLHSLMEYKQVPKKTMLLRAGEACNFEAYVIKGCLRKYYIDANGFEVILQFAIEDAWISDISFTAQDNNVSRVYIETLEDCELLLFTFDNKEELLARAPRFERAFRILVQRSLVTTQNRLFTTIAMTAQEKYLEFLAQYPTLPQRVAQHYIASYLGISAEFLSKIRKKISQSM